MKEANVEVISVCLSAFLFYDQDKVPERFRNLNDDHQRQFDVLKESGLKYVAVFPPHIGGTYEFKTILRNLNFNVTLM